MSDEDELMKHEAEIAIIGDRMEQLGIKVDDLKISIKSDVGDIHKHIERKFSDELKLCSLSLKQEITLETDKKITDSIDNIKAMIKTWAMLLLFGVSGTVGVTAYIAMVKSNEPKSSVAQDMVELYKVISQENRKNVKQTEVIMKPERVIP